MSTKRILKIIHGTYKIVIYNISILYIFLFYFVFMSRLIFGQHNFQWNWFCKTIVERVSQLCHTSVQLILQSGIPMQTCIAYKTVADTKETVLCYPLLSANRRSSRVQIPSPFSTHSPTSLHTAKVGFIRCVVFESNQLQSIVPEWRLSRTVYT